MPCDFKSLFGVSLWIRGYRYLEQETLKTSPNMWLATGEKNSGARRFYDRVGWRALAQLRRRFWLGRTTSLISLLRAVAELPGAPQAGAGTAGGVAQGVAVARLSALAPVAVLAVWLWSKARRA